MKHLKYEKSFPFIPEEAEFFNIWMVQIAEYMKEKKRDEKGTEEIEEV